MGALVAVVAALTVAPAVGGEQARATLRLRMDAAHSPGGHVAVWVGANDAHNTDWIQGGIEFSTGDRHPWIYLETGHNGLQTLLHRTATRFGVTSTFRLVSSGRYWQIVTNGHLSPVRIRLHDPAVQVIVEKLGAGSTTAVAINGRVQ